MDKEGVFIVIEGTDGSGKDTQLELIQKYFDERNIDYVTVKDPSPQVAGFIRDGLLGNDGLENNTRLFLYLAARSELLYKQILPALKEGKVVLCNRYKLSTYCYQGLFFTREEIDAASRAGGLEEVQPDLQIVYLTRQSFRSKEADNVMDQYCNSNRDRILGKYLQLSEDPELKIEIVWADEKDIESVHKETLSRLKKVLDI
jgi:dTMP kinase